MPPVRQWKDSQRTRGQYNQGMCVCSKKCTATIRVAIIHNLESALLPGLTMVPVSMLLELSMDCDFLLYHHVPLAPKFHTIITQLSYP